MRQEYNVGGMPVKKYSIPKWETKKKKILSLALDFIEQSDGAFSDYWNTVKPRTKHPYASEFFKTLEFEPHLEFGMNESECLCTSMWCMKYLKEGSIHVHDHNYGMSGILYANFDPTEHKATTFIPPIRDIWSNGVINFTPDVTEGDLILFPSQLLHFSNPVTSNKPRIIYSFNFGTTFKKDHGRVIDEDA
tara:strand:+ start:4591 stop:5163 length:573 start_codon:yes stop_codon:yes gene_type:complete